MTATASQRPQYSQSQQPATQPQPQFKTLCLSIPSLGLLPSLKCLRFQGMEGWEEWKCENVSGAFIRLQELYIEDCPKLKEHLPAQLPSLKKLVIDGCMQLVASIPSTPSLHELDLRNCEKLQLECLPSTLKVLHINGRLPEIFSVEKIENTFSDTCFEKLKIFNCGNLELPLRHCYNFLLKLKIERSCDSLTSFSLDLFPKLQSLKLIECSNLEKISVSEGHHDSLTELTIWMCPKFVSFPTGGFSAPKLENLYISELESLKSLPGRMYILFPSLRYLELCRCLKLESFPEGGLPSTLKALVVIECPKLIASRMEWDLHGHNSLKHFTFEADTDVESFPDAGLLPPTLAYLNIWRCPNLRMLEQKGLCHLSALQHLSLKDCPKLQHLPKEGLPSSLSTLRIRDCPLLKKRCQKQKGKMWAKIAHIPAVEIDGDIVT